LRPPNEQLVYGTVLQKNAQKNTDTANSRTCRMAKHCIYYRSVVYRKTS